jgi:hypothetical protein
MPYSKWVCQNVGCYEKVIMGYLDGHFAEIESFMKYNYKCTNCNATRKMKIMNVDIKV